jgi:hypothetical protein
LSTEGSTEYRDSGWGLGMRFAFIDADNMKKKFEDALKRRKIADEEISAFDLNKIFGDYILDKADASLHIGFEEIPP